jgi:uroporphyrinogen decarboxylase
MKFPKLKNDLLLRALKGENVERPPVWMMRQAGRFLPDYRVLREQYSFFERCETPHLVSKITTMPIWQVGPDAAILFSDILVVPIAMGYHVDMIPGEGPRFPKTVRNMADVEAIKIPDVEKSLAYVMAGIMQTRMDLKGEVPLIGFAGAPWTILCYMVQGKGSKDFSEAKRFCFEQPEAAKLLLQKITNTTISYMKSQIKSGAQVFQLFDSWAGLLSPEDFMVYSYPYLKQIIAQCSVPNILFAKGSWYALEELKATGADAIGVDWAVSPEKARKILGHDITIQGNFDPSRLYASIPEIEKWTKEMINRFGKNRYIVNLGHGILPNVPVDHAKAFINAVKNYS